MTAPTARITVHRRSPHDEGERQLYVSLDGERLGRLRFGRALSREIASGSHRLRVHNTFSWKAVDVDAQPGDDLHFAAVNLTPGCMVGVAAALGAAPMFVRLHPLPGAPDEPPSGRSDA
jgi:hypothetical protein